MQMALIAYYGRLTRYVVYAYPTKQQKDKQTTEKNNERKSIIQVMKLPCKFSLSCPEKSIP